MTAQPAGRFDPLRTALLDRSACPACGAPLTGPRCLWCGVPLDGPAAEQVLGLSVEAADALVRREAGVRQLYAERDARFVAGPTLTTAQRTAAARAAVPTAAPGPYQAPRPAPRRPPVVRTANRRPAPPGGNRAATRHRWRVQAVLQSLGAGLLSAAGIVFLVFSWDVLDLALRAAIVALGTVLVFGLSGGLARRGLRQGAEAVGAVAAVLLVLDAWALRRTGVVELGEPEVYASVASVACAVVLTWWGRLARLTVGTVAGAVLWFGAPLPLAWLDPSARTVAWAALASVVLGSVRHLPRARLLTAVDAAARSASSALAVGASAAWAVATLAAVGSLATAPRGALVLLAAATVVAALQLVLCRRAPTPTDVPLAGAWSVGSVAAGLTATLAAVGLDVRAPLVGAALVASGCVVAAVAARISGLPEGPGTAHAVTGSPRPAPSFPGTVSGTVLRQPGVALGPAAAVLVAAGAGALLRSAPATVALMLAVAAVGALVDSRDRTARSTGRERSRQTAARVTVVAATLLSLVAAHRSLVATGVALAGCAAAAVLSRTWVSDGASAGRSTAMATPLGLAAVATLARAAGAAVPDAVTIAAATGAAVLSLVVVAPDRTRSERQVALLGAAGATACVWVLDAVVPLWWGRSALLLATAACLLVVVALTAGEERVGRAATVVGAASAAPVVALSALSAGALLRPAHTYLGATLLGAGVGAAAVLLATVARDRRGPRAAVAAAAGGWVTLAGSLAAGEARSPALSATVLLIASVAALVTGLRDRVPALRWGALVLATAASWTLLTTGQPTDPELFTAPTAVVVAVVGALRVRKGRPDGAPLLGGGLALTLLPTALLRGSLLLPADAHVDRRAVTVAAALLVTAAAAWRGTRGPDRAATVLAALAVCLDLLGPLRAGLAAASGAGSSVLPDLLGLLAATLLLISTTSIRHSGAEVVARPCRALEPWVVTAAAVLPSALAAVPGTPGIVRLSALGLVGVSLTLVGAVRAGDTVGPWTSHLMGVGVLVSTAAVTVAHRVLPAVRTDLVLVPLGLLLVSTLLLRPPRRLASDDLVRSVAAIALLVPVLAARSEPWRPFLWLAISVALLGGAWSVRGRSHAAPAVRLVSAAAAGIALAGPWYLAVAALLHRAGPLVDAPERWTLPAAGVVLAASVVGWPRTAGVPSLLTLISPAVGVAALASVLAVDASGAGTLRTGAALVIGGLLAALAQEQRLVAREAAVRHDARIPSATGLAVATAGALAAAVAGPWPTDVPILVLGLLLGALGVRYAMRDAVVGTWTALGPALVCTLAVPAVVSTADPAPWRPVVVVTLAAAATVTGAVARWQAPFVVGAATLVVVTLVQLGPWAGQVLVQTRGWLLLAVCGTLLLALGLRYERRLTQAREAVRFVAGMR